VSRLLYGLQVGILVFAFMYPLFIALGHITGTLTKPPGTMTQFVLLGDCVIIGLVLARRLM